MRPLPFHYRDEVHKTFREYLKQGVAVASTSPWASNILCVPKKTGEVRPCADLREVNGLTRFNAGPLPRIDAIFDAARGWRYFWNLDISSAYLSFEIEPEDRCKTAILIPGLGLVEYVRMVFGLQNAPAFFTRQMHRLLDGGPDGLDVQRRVVAQAPAWLSPHGLLLVETGRDQAPATSALMTAAGLTAEVHFDDDVAGCAVSGRRGSPGPL